MSLIGTEINYYRLTKHLGKGGTSDIYLGQHIFNDELAAFKILFPEFISNPDVFERFKKEADAIKGLNHKHIISVQDYGTHSDQIYYIAMQYVSGGDLAVTIQEYKEREELVPVAYWLPLLKQVASALDHAHDNGLIHRDIKPQNILITERNNAMLTDFGLILDTNIGSLGLAFGTPRYIAPEQAIASESATAKSDIYSLAVILYELLTGYPVFPGEDIYQLTYNHIHIDPINPSILNEHLPASVAEQIMIALEKEPGDRHNTATSLVSAIETAFGDDTAIKKFDEICLAESRRKAAEKDATSTQTMETIDTVPDEEDTGD